MPLSNSDEKRSPQADTGSAQAIQAWMVSRLSDLFGIDPCLIDVREPFASYGMGSTEAVSLSGELADWLGRDLAPDLFYECTTIESLARYLAASRELSEVTVPAAHDRETIETPIAIIGIGCRFPGAANPEAFWQLLCNGIDSITEVPAQRFDVDSYYDSDSSIPGKINTRWGGFLDNVDAFDAHFFGISPREAARMDPQQRLLLEVAWEALEDAGQVPERLAGTNVGIFLGISNNDYGRAQFNDLKRIDAYAGTGNALSVAANRISYIMDFRGPSVAVDTACSSSLVAVHLACSSLSGGESTLALAAGVNLILSPAITVNFTKAGVMAPDGRCKTFDARANGYVRGEGAGVVVLKRLAQALSDGDPIYAIIRGSAVNQDGRSNGLMAPNPLAQEAVLREAYRRAAVSPGQVQYIEAHGTGTLLGDPIEVKALGKVLASDRLGDGACALGSVKTNIGHLEAAAGIAGLIKTALALKHRQIPPSLHFKEPNPLIPFDDLPLRVQTNLGSWAVAPGHALAGVSSFGFGGTNAHVVMADSCSPAPSLSSHDYSHRNGASDQNGSKQAAHVLALSARNPEALRSLARAYRELFADCASDTSLRDICYTAGVRRGHSDYRLALTGNSPEQMVSGLEGYLLGESRPGLSSGHRISGRDRKLVFVFSGQGSQWFGMGRKLLQQCAAFRSMLERCDHALRPYNGWSLLTELAIVDPDESRLDEIEVLQPALFSLQVALAAQWRAWGIEPDAVVGHSMGEAAAACVAGALTLEDAARVICLRSRLIKPTIGLGAMAAVELSLEDAQRAIAGYEGRLSVGVSNSPTSSVFSGDPVALKEVTARLQAQDVFCRIVAVDFAAHSPQMVPLQTELSRALMALRPQASRIPIYSTVTGGLIDGLHLTAAYWARNLREPVLFSAAIQHLLEDGHSAYIECSPHPIALGAIQQGAQHLSVECAGFPSLRRREDDRTVMLGSLGALYALGYPVEWKRLYPDGGNCAALPLYPWQRERHWLDAPEPAVELRTPDDPPPPDNIDDCLYQLLWQPDEEHPTATPGAPGACWLILVDQSGVGEALATKLEAQGQRCVRVAAGDSFDRVDGDHFRIHPERPEHLQQLAAVVLPVGTSFRGVVHLWSLDTARSDDLTTASLEAAQVLGCNSVLHLVQQFTIAEQASSPLLWIVTRGAQAVGEEPAMSMPQAPLWGLGRVIAQEHSALWGGLTDLDPDIKSPGLAADQLWQQISAPGRENQVAFRQGRRYVLRLVRRPQAAVLQAPFRLRADSTYLITGGLGDLGLVIARWMIDRGARRLILLGRTELPARSHWKSVEAGTRVARQVSAIHDLEALGASIHLASVDVADEVELSAFLNQFHADGWPPIRGLVHAAGVTHDGLLSQLDIASFNRVLRPKVTGGWLLHRLLANTPLDFFVLFSSAGALLGQPGQGNYAAANAFVDSLAHYRRARGLPALTINWGAWTNLGFANSPGGKRLGAHLASLGIDSLTRGQALEVLSRLLQQDATQAVAVPVDWSKYHQFFEAGGASSMLSDLAREAGALQPSGEPSGLRRDTLLAAQPDLRHQLLQCYLVGQVARVLGLSASKVEVHQPLTNLGLDSLMAVELKNRVALDLGVNLPMVKFLQGPSVDQAANLILDQLVAEAGDAPASLSSPLPYHQPERENGRSADPHYLPGLDQLSDEEVNSMLVDILAEGSE